MLAWATSMIERRKVQIELPVLSVETVGNYIFVLGFEEAFQPLLGQISAQAGDDESITVSVDNPQLVNFLTKDPETGAFFYKYRDAQDVERTVYIEDAGSISHKLRPIAEI